MSSDSGERAALLALLGRTFVGEQAMRMVLFQQAIADRLGVNTTDLICLSFLHDAEPLTAGQLAEVTGLTTGSVTIMIDRLEKAGYVQRAKDPTDRRRVIVRPVTERIEHDITPVYTALGEAWGRAVDRYSMDELAVILDMLTRSNVLLHEQTTALRLGERAHAVPSDTPREVASAPSEPQVHQARLLFLNGTFNVTVGGADLRALYQARFEAPEPQVVLVRCPKLGCYCSRNVHMRSYTSVAVARLSICPSLATSVAAWTLGSTRRAWASAWAPLKKISCAP
jgi:DNA-binding MarR family transcriptional regulator